jgi:hypothetical protein
VTADYIRDYYKVPAKVGMRIKFRGCPGVITGFGGASLHVRLDGATDSIICHPTWEISYPSTTDRKATP